MADIKILVKDCVKIYKNQNVSTVAVRKLKCAFYSGEITIIMGPSGSGKSTLLNILGGMDTCDSGEILFDNQDITKFNDKELDIYRKKVGFLFQFFNLIPELTAEDNICLPILLKNGKYTKTDKAYVKKLLEQVGLSDRANNKPNELSGGEQQRIALAVALANDPEILLCDEPTGELDTQSKLNIMKLLHEQIQKKPNLSIIVVTHDLAFKQIADRLYIIKDGIIIHELNKEEMQKEKEEDVMTKAISSQKFDALIDKEQMLNELLELQNMLKEKINKLKS